MRFIPRCEATRNPGLLYAAFDSIERSFEEAAENQIGTWGAAHASHEWTRGKQLLLPWKFGFRLLVSLASCGCL